MVGFKIGYDFGYINGERQNGYCSDYEVWKEYYKDAHFPRKLLEEEGK